MHCSYASVFYTEHNIVVNKCTVPMLQCFLQNKTLSANAPFLCYSVLCSKTWHCRQHVHASLVWHNGLNRTTWHCYQCMRYSCDTMVWTERLNTVISACATRVTQWSEQNGHGTVISAYATHVHVCVWKCDTRVWTERHNTVIRACTTHVHVCVCERVTQCSEQNDITLLSGHALLVWHNGLNRTDMALLSTLLSVHALLVWQHVLNRA